ncbi:MAG: response regulator transcription factor [Myxococcota bacterium]|nr:response regulator transcription factor [Myxococcota bacterium]
MQKPQVLVVDDDLSLRKFVKAGLEDLGIATESAANADEAEKVLAARPSLNLMLLDVMMPGRTGWEFIQDLRESGNEIPVIFLTARQEVDERIKGLKMGADDYMIKPFEFQELLARIEAVMRRQVDPSEFSVADLKINLPERIVERGGTKITTTDQEFRLLRVLVEADGAVVNRADLLKKVWDMDFDPGTNILEVQIARLRRKIDCFDPPLIQTVTGHGYRLCSPLAN